MSSEDTTTNNEAVDAQDVQGTSTEEMSENQFDDYSVSLLENTDEPDESLEDTGDSDNDSPPAKEGKETVEKKSETYAKMAAIERENRALRQERKQLAAIEEALKNQDIVALAKAANMTEEEAIYKILGQEIEQEENTPDQTEILQQRLEALELQRTQEEAVKLLTGFINEANAVVDSDKSRWPILVTLCESEEYASQGYTPGHVVYQKAREYYQMTGQHIPIDVMADYIEKSYAAGVENAISIQKGREKYTKPTNQQGTGPTLSNTNSSPVDTSKMTEEEFDSWWASLL